MENTRQLKREKFTPITYLLLAVALFFTMVLCICVGSVPIAFSDTVTAVWNAVWGLPVPENIAKNIIFIFKEF